MKNQLMIYHGGGYDGCFWELNWCAWNNEGQWYNLYSSGRDGLDTEDKCKIFMKNEDAEYCLYNLLDEKSMETLTTVRPVYVCYKILSGLVKYDILNFLKLECTECGFKSDDPDDFLLDGLEGIGGIAITYTELLCQKCWDKSHCSHCGEWSENLFTSSSFTHICEHCLTREIKFTQGVLQRLIKKQNAEKRQIKGITSINNNLKEMQNSFRKRMLKTV